MCGVVTSIVSSIEHVTTRDGAALGARRRLLHPPFVTQKGGTRTLEPIRSPVRAIVNAEPVTRARRTVRTHTRYMPDADHISNHIEDEDVHDASYASSDSEAYAYDSRDEASFDESSFEITTTRERRELRGGGRGDRILRFPATVSGTRERNARGGGLEETPSDPNQGFKGREETLAEATTRSETTWRGLKAGASRRKIERRPTRRKRR